MPAKGKGGVDFNDVSAVLMASIATKARAASRLLAAADDAAKARALTYAAQALRDQSAEILAAG